MKFSKTLLTMVILTLFSSCSKKTDDENPQNNNSNIGSRALPVSPTQNTDGDLETDIVELENGRNPYIADIPDYDFKFSQNFKLIFKNQDSSITHIIDSTTNRDDPDFKYSVGSLLIRSKSFNDISKFAKFSSHHHGQIDDFELNWFKYPSIDQKFFHYELLRLKDSIFNQHSDENSYSVIFKNTLILKRNTQFQEIKNLKLKFHYYNYETNSYEYLATKTIENRFLAGVRTEFEVEIENLPSHLIYDNFFTKGEFIIAEIVDYEIPSYEKNYSTLIGQVKHFSIPVAINSPLGSKVKYIGLNGEKKLFSEILQIIYPNDFVIESDSIKRIEQFETSLTGYTYLKEVKKDNKNGRWFIVTNKLDRQYQDYPFSNKDKIVLSFMTGFDLGNQNDSVIYQYTKKAIGQEAGSEYELGDLSSNSRIDIQIMPKRRFGNNLVNNYERVHQTKGSCGRNCIRWDYDCRYDVNTITSYDESFSFQNDLNKEFERISLYINNEEFSLVSLLNDKKIKTYFKNENLHILIEDIEKIVEIEPSTENKLFLKINSKKYTSHNGVKVTHASGTIWNQACSSITFDMGRKYGTRVISESSLSSVLGYLKHAPNWNPDMYREFSFQGNISVFNNMEVDFSSTITNFFN